MAPVRPALDPELHELLADLPLRSGLDRDVDRRDLAIPASDGARIPLTVLTPARRPTAAPCVFWVHGGGMVMGDRLGL